MKPKTEWKPLHAAFHQTGMNVDQLIDWLEKVRAQHGGHLPVFVTTPSEDGDHLVSCRAMGANRVVLFGDMLIPDCEELEPIDE